MTTQDEKKVICGEHTRKEVQLLWRNGQRRCANEKVHQVAIIARRSCELALESTCANT